jgi:hypothetical protein
LQKLGLEGKTNGALNVFTLRNLEFWKCKKQKNVFTLEPIAQATLVVTKMTQKYKKWARYELMFNDVLLFGDGHV